MNSIFRKLIAMLAVVVFVTTSCDDTLDINQSPNNPASSTTAFTLPVAQVTIAAMINLDLGIMTGYLNQYWTQAFQAAQYQVYDNYTYNGNQTSTAWLHAYAWALEDLKFVREKAIEDGTPNYEAISLILSAYTYQILVDVWGDVPYSEALQGKQGNLNPNYDDGQAVYDNVIVLLDEALSLIDAGPAAITPAGDDLIFSGDMSAWIRFANTLKLRVYIRQSTARPSVAQSGIAAMYAAGDEFLGASEQVIVPFSGTSENQNPLFRGDASPLGLANNNINGSATGVSAFTAAGDPRVDFYYDPNGAGIQVGIVQGNGLSQSGGARSLNSVPSTTNVVGPASPVYFMSGFESLLLQAEAVERGFGTGTASALYDAGVQAAFDFAGYSADAAGLLAGNYAYPAGTQTQNLDAIANQKWLAMNGIMNVESWAETRRNGYFSFVPTVPGAGAALNGSTFPQRALYPTSEISVNPNAPVNGNIGDPIWWMN